MEVLCYWKPWRYGCKDFEQPKSCFFLKCLSEGQFYVPIFLLSLRMLDPIFCLDFITKFSCLLVFPHNFLVLHWEVVTWAWQSSVETASWILKPENSHHFKPHYEGMLPSLIYYIYIYIFVCSFKKMTISSCQHWTLSCEDDCIQEYLHFDIVLSL